MMQGTRPTDLSRLTVAGLISILRQHFAPSSTLLAPASTLQARGNRTVSISTSTTNPPTDSAYLQFNNGKIVWNFQTQFSKAPRVTICPIGQSPSGKPWYLNEAPTPNGCVILSEDPTDTRHVQCHAIQDV